MSLARLALAAALGALPLIALGCARPDGPARSVDPLAAETPAVETPADDAGGEPAATTAAPAPDADIVYELPEPGLCGVVDQTPLADIFPTDGGKPLVDAPGICSTARLSRTMTVGLDIDAELFRDAERARDFYDMMRKTARTPPTDLPGIGSGAFWFADRNRCRVVAYHGNLALTVTVETVNDNHQLPDGLPERLGRMAAATFTRLAP